MKNKEFCYWWANIWKKYKILSLKKFKCLELFKKIMNIWIFEKFLKEIESMAMNWVHGLSPWIESMDWVHRLSPWIESINWPLKNRIEIRKIIKLFWVEKSIWIFKNHEEIWWKNLKSQKFLMRKWKNNLMKID